MKEKKKGYKILKRLLVSLLVLCFLGFGVFYFLPDEQKVRFFEALGIEDSDYVKNKQLENYVVIRNTNSRRALVGDKWIISGKLFNLHETVTVKQVKLMFNFSDGVETITLIDNIPPKNTLGKKFKEKISGHGDADFISVDVIDAK
jgi:hypothetical protein